MHHIHMAVLYKSDVFSQITMDKSYLFIHFLYYLSKHRSSDKMNAFIEARGEFHQIRNPNLISFNERFIFFSNKNI